MTGRQCRMVSRFHIPSEYSISHPGCLSPFTNPPNYAILPSVEHRFVFVIRALGGRRSRGSGHSYPPSPTVRAFVLGGKGVVIVLHFALPPLPGTLAARPAGRAVGARHSPSCLTIAGPLIRRGAWVNHEPNGECLAATTAVWAKMV